MRLGFWLASTDAAGCCRFSGGPYLAPEFLGNGMAIATPGERPGARRSHRLRASGDLGERHVRRALPALFPGQLF